MEDDGINDGRDSSSGDSRSRGSSRGSTRCDRREPWDEEEEALSGRPGGSGDGLAWPVWEGWLCRRCAFTQGLSTEDYLFYMTDTIITTFIIMILTINLYGVLWTIQKNSHSTRLLQGIACSRLVHIRSTWLSLLRFPRIFWYNYTHRRYNNTVEHMDRPRYPRTWPSRVLGSCHQQGRCPPQSRATSLSISPYNLHP